MPAPFIFEGGDILTRIGASWFISYNYCKDIDSTHTNWTKVETTELRKKYFEKSTNYHETWVHKILHMEDSRLNRNKIGLSAEDIKRMAKKLAEHYAKT